MDKISADQENERIKKQLDFIVEVDKLKTILRRSLITNKARHENSAEHSWHAALMAVVMEEHQLSSERNLTRVLKMLLVHDLVEIDAGDTYCYDVHAHQDKAEREIRAADRLFGLLPSDQAIELRNLWDEFESGQTPESQYARALDRLNPFLLNYYADGISWKQHGVARRQVMERMEETMRYIPRLKPTINKMIDHAVANGWILP